MTRTLARRGLEPEAGPCGAEGVKGAGRSGALQGLRQLAPSDGPRYKSAVEQGKQIGFGYYFPFVLAQQRGTRSVLWCEDDGALCLFLLRGGRTRERLDVLLAPAPTTRPVALRCVERANAFNGDRSARILRIDQADAPLVAGLPGLRIKERKPQYLYAPRTLGAIRGNRFRTLRRNVERVGQRRDLEVVPYSVELEEPCRTLLRRWQGRHHDAHGTAGGVGTSRRAIELAGVLTAPDLLGEVVFLGGQLVAFAFGGEVRPGLGCFFEARSDHEVPGLAYFQRHSFLSKLGDFDLVNDGSDAGRSGLRQLKNSLRPTAMHLEYRATQLKTS